MKRWRARVGLYGPATLLVFVASVTAPHTGVVVHAHAGGEHFHVHAELLDESPHEHAHTHTHPHAHHALLVDGSSTVPELAALDDDAHWHAQHPFHRAAPGAVATVFPPFAAAPAPATQDLAPASRTLPFCRARAPPRSVES